MEKTNAIHKAGVESSHPEVGCDDNDRKHDKGPLQPINHCVLQRRAIVDVIEIVCVHWALPDKKLPAAGASLSIQVHQSKQIFREDFLLFNLKDS